MSSEHARNFCGLFLLLQGLRLAALHQVLGPTPWHRDQAQLPGFLTAPYDVASGPIPSSSGNPWHPSRGTRQCAQAGCPHWTPRVLMPPSVLLHKEPGTGSGESSPLVWGSLRRTFWKEPKVCRDLGLRGKDTFP